MEMVTFSCILVLSSCCLVSPLPSLLVLLGGKGIQLVSFLSMQRAQSAAKSPEMHLRKWGDTNIMYSHSAPLPSVENKSLHTQLSCVLFNSPAPARDKRLFSPFCVFSLFPEHLSTTPGEILSPQQTDGSLSK